MFRETVSRVARVACALTVFVLAGCATPAARPADPAPPTAAPTSPVRVTQVKCERQDNPIGLDIPAPLLSWLLESDRPNQKQSAYRILVASSRQRLDADEGDLWDSGRVATDISIGVPYAGKPLVSRQVAHWKVMVWDGDGQASAFSEPALFEMGLLTADDWTARFIGRPARTVVPPTIDRAAMKLVWAAPPPARKAAGAGKPRNHDGAWVYLRRRFTVSDPAALPGALAFTLATGRTHLYVNGELVDSGTGNILRYTDVRPWLRAGENVVAIAARKDREPDAVAAQLSLAPGPSIGTDETWRLSKDEAENWMSPDFDDRGWARARVVGEPGKAPFDKLASSPMMQTRGEPPAYLRRRACSVGKRQGRPLRARLYATALGIYELYLSGRRVGDQYLAPGWTDYGKRLEYQTYDVTPLIDGPCHELAAVLADGWYTGAIGYQSKRAHYGAYPLRLRAQLEVTWPDGTIDRVVSDERWQAGEGPIRSADFLRGEVYDARAELPGWPRVPADAPSDGWVPVDVMSAPLPARLHADAGPPVRIVKDIAPKSVKQVRPGVHIFDIGQNMVGFARLKVRGPAGHKVKLRFVEMLNPDGTAYTRNLRTAHQTDEYILRGHPAGEIWEPRFTTHGFRYIEVTNFPGEPSPSTLLARVLQSDTPRTGQLRTSNTMVNKLFDNIQWGQRGNFVGLPTDCPQRDERLGWMGDAQIFARTACFNMDVGNFFRAWMRDVYDEQDESGGLPDTVPYLEGLGKRPGAPAWADAGVIVPWEMYRCTGDRRFLDEFYPGMQKFIALVERSNPDLIWKNAVGHNYGDWLSINADTPKDLLATAYFAHSTGLLANIAKVLGHEQDHRRYTDLRKRIAEAFARTFVADDGKLAGDTQTAYLLALNFELLPPDKRDGAARHLVAAIERANFHLTTGFLGVRELLPVLTDVGRVDLAYRLLLNDTFPSWGYSIKHGATTIWERWDGWTADKGFQSDGMNSFNHYSLGSVGQWLYETLAGIAVDPEQPGYKNILFQPRPGGDLQHASARVSSPHGLVGSQWRIDDGRFVLTVQVPVNSSGTVLLPDGQRHHVGSGEHEFTAPWPVTTAAR